MALRKLRPRTLMSAGMFALVAGALSLRFAARIPGVTPDAADGISGLCYGTAIATLLLGIRSRARGGR